MSRSSRSVSGCLLLLAALPFGLPAQADEARAAVQAGQAASMTVATDEARLESVATTTVGTGIVEVWQEAVVSSETSGLTLSDVLVAEGDRVEKGQVVARLDATLLEAEIAEQDAAIRSAEAQLQEAQAAADRAAQLARTGNISGETVQERATALETAGAAVDQAKAKRQTLAVQAERATIRAPFAGIVSAKPAVAGTVVQVGTEIVRIQRDGLLEATLKVPEARLASLSVGDGATIVGLAGESIEAAVSSISPVVDPATHLASVSVRLAEGSGLRAGMFVRGTIRHRSGEERLTVAAGTLTWQEGKATVFVVADDGTVARRRVEIGERTGTRVVVTGDLRAGEVLATAGAGFLNDGDTVAVAQLDALGQGAGQ